MVGSNYIKIFFCAWVFVFNSTTHAQINLVPNSSFEDTVPPPRPPGNFAFLQTWTNPTGGSPDYYSVFSPGTFVPSGGGGVQYPNTGNAFIGIVCYVTNGINGREYVQIQLIDTLISNNCYYASFYANVANWGDKSCNNLGMYLSDTAIYSTTIDFLEYTSQIKNFNNEIINDTLDWHKIEGIYAANGGELFLTLGNFNNDLTTDTVISNYSGIDRAYYLIDDVSVIPIDSIPGGMPAYAGADTNVILGDSVFIGQKISNLNCNWYNAIGSLIASGTSGIYVSPTTSTYYVVEQNLCGVITYDTVNVTVLPVSIYELQNKIEVRIYPNPNNGSFTIQFLQTGNYQVELINSLGITVYQKQINSDLYTIKTKQPNGWYLLKTTHLEDNTTYFLKMIIQH